MKRNYLNKKKTGFKILLAGLFLFGTLFTNAQCTANFTYSLGANGWVYFTSTSTGTSVNTSYAWNFTGTSIIAGTSATHAYSTNGLKNVCLTITDSVANCTSTKCDTLTITSNVTNTTIPCNANFTYSLGANGSVSFVSTSTGTFASTNYSWSFGGSSYGSGTAPTHTYSSNGTKTVCLTITNSSTSCSSTKCDTLFISNIPTTTTTPCSANFSYSLGANGSVSFANTSTGTSGSTYYSWNFGGSAYGSGTAPTHTYSSNGTKTVCLTIVDSTSACSSTKCDTLNITSISGSVTPCTPSVVYTLTKDSTTALTWNAYPYYPSNITNATWYWGDGSSTTGLYPSHTYSAAGTYSTCVTISVSCGTITATYCYVAAIFRSSQSNDMILINVKQSTVTGIKNQAMLESQMSIYPNPNNGEFVLELNNDGNILKENTVFVYNMLGEKVFEKHIPASGKQTIDVSNLANGTYLLKVDSDAGYLHKKITIQK